MPTETIVTTDIEALRRGNEPSVDTGQATAGGAATLTDAAKTWMVNEWATKVVEITEGTGKGQFRNIVSNTATVLTVAPAWTVVPDNTSYYRIGLVTSAGGGGSTMDSGVSTGGGAAALIDALRGWDIGVWEGKIIKITSGAASGDIRKIISNTATQVNVANNFTAAIVAGVNYEIMDNAAVTADVRRSATSTLVPLAKQNEEGIVTTAGAGILTLADTAKLWAGGMWINHYVRIVSGTGAGTVRRIMSNTATVLTVNSVMTVGVDSKYIIFSNIADVAKQMDEGVPSGLAVGATLDDTGKKWDVNMWTGHYVRIVSGTALAFGQVRRIISNTANQLTVANAWATQPDVDCRYIIFALPLTGATGKLQVDAALSFLGDGIATAGAAGVLTDGTKNWDSNSLVNYMLIITGGTGAGLVSRITANTAVSISFSDAGVTPDATSIYRIAPWNRVNPADPFGNMLHPMTELVAGLATAGGAGTLTDGTQNWDVNIWTGCMLVITAGTGIGLASRILSNTATQITFNDVGVTPDATSVYKVVVMPLTSATGVPSANIASVGGTAQTTYDWTGLLRAVTKDEGLVTVLAVGATLTDAAKAWDVNMWVGKYVRVVSGTGAGQVRIITSNTATVLTVTNAWAVQPTTDSRYVIFDLPASNILGEAKAQHNITGISNGRKVVAVAGTRETLVAATTPCKKVNITAETDNSDIVVIGGATCVAALATRSGTPLAAGQSTGWFEIDDLLDINVDAVVATEGVTFTYLT